MIEALILFCVAYTIVDLGGHALNALPEWMCRD